MYTLRNKLLSRAWKSFKTVIHIIIQAVCKVTIMIICGSHYLSCYSPCSKRKLQFTICNFSQTVANIIVSLQEHLKSTLDEYYIALFSVVM